MRFSAGTIYAMEHADVYLSKGKPRDGRKKANWLPIQVAKAFKSDLACSGVNFGLLNNLKEAEISSIGDVHRCKVQVDDRVRQQSR